MRRRKFIDAIAFLLLRTYSIQWKINASAAKANKDVQAKKTKSEMPTVATIENIL
jgi:hypothetical protein